MQHRSEGERKLVVRRCCSEILLGRECELSLPLSRAREPGLISLYAADKGFLFAPKTEHVLPRHVHGERPIVRQGNTHDQSHDSDQPLLVYLGNGWYVQDCADLLFALKNTFEKYIKRLRNAGELPAIATPTPMPGTVRWLQALKYIVMLRDETLLWPDKNDRNFKKLLTYLEKTVCTMYICVFVITCEEVGAAVRAAHLCGVVVCVVCDYD